MDGCGSPRALWDSVCVLGLCVLDSAVLGRVGVYGMMYCAIGARSSGPAQLNSTQRLTMTVTATATCRAARLKLPLACAGGWRPALQRGDASTVRLDPLRRERASRLIKCAKNPRAAVRGAK